LLVARSLLRHAYTCLSGWNVVSPMAQEESPRTKALSFRRSAHPRKWCRRSTSMRAIFG